MPLASDRRNGAEGVTSTRSSIGPPPACPQALIAPGPSTTPERSAQQVNVDEKRACRHHVEDPLDRLRAIGGTPDAPRRRPACERSALAVAGMHKAA